MKQLGAKSTQKRTVLLLTVLAAALIPTILRGNEYYLMVFCFIELYTIAASGLDILFGYCGQISMGHAAFYAIGAYGSGLLHNFTGLPVLLCMLLACVLAAAVGAVLAYPASKLKFHFLSLATIAFGEIIYQILIHSPNNVTGNFSGLFTEKISLFGLVLNNYQKNYYFGLVAVLLFLLVKYTLVRSRTGRAFSAVRDNSIAAEGMGINSRKYKIIAFATSAFFVAFAGAFYMHMTGYVHPDTFVQKQSVLFLTMILLGGTASLIGPVLGAVIIEVLMENIRFLQDYQMFVYGCILLIVIVLIPGGVVKELQKLFRYLSLRMKRKKEAVSHAEH